MINLQEEIKKYRAKKFLDKTHFALECGMSPSGLSHVLAGRAAPTAQMLDVLGLELIETKYYKRKKK